MKTLIDMNVVLVGLLTAIIVIEHIDSSKVFSLSAESDEENTLRQALYLVKLLKAEHMKYLRENRESVTNDTDDANSTCPEDDFNSTTPLLYTVPVSIPPAMLASLPNPVAPSSHAAPMLARSALPEYIAPNIPDVGGQPSTNTNSPPHMIQAGPAQYIPPGGNYNYPYRINERRMMPADDDYGDLMSRFGGYRRADYDSRRIARRMDYGENYRRFGYIDQPGLLSEQASYKGYRREADGGDGGREISDTTGTQVAVSNKTVTWPRNVSENTTAKSPLVLSVSKSMKARLISTPNLKIFYQRTERPNNVNALQALGKASRVDVWKDIKQVRKDNVARQRITIEDRVASEVASQLLYEIKGTRSEKITAILRHGIDSDNLPYTETPTFTRSTMKIFLKGSSRMQIPFSENNAFCHLYPHNKLCGSGI